MNVTFEKSFLKSVEKLTNNQLKAKIIVIINNVQKAESLTNISQLKKLTGYKTYYRIKSGDYRY